MKKIIIVVFLFLLLIPCMAPAQDLDPIIRDLSAMLEGVGNDILPYLQQTVIAGEGIGRASIGLDSRFYAGFTLGSTFSPGLLTFIDEENTNFELLNVYGLLNDALSAEEGQSTILDTFKTFFFFPTVRLTAGVRLPLGMDLSALFSIIPGALTGAIANAAGFPGIELRQFNLGVRLRKVLVHDEEGFPAVSIGGGYTYASFGAGFDLGDLGGTFSQQIGSNYLSLDGAIGMSTAVHTAGVDFIISKKLLVFYPFFRVSPWYQWARYDGGITGFNAAFYDNAELSGEPIVQTDDDPVTVITKNDLSLILAAGFEVALGKFILTPSGSFDLGTKRFHANLSMRLQF